MDISHIPRFYVPFWLSHILVYLFYLCSSLDISQQDIRKINQQECALARKRNGNAINAVPVAASFLFSNSQ